MEENALHSGMEFMMTASDEEIEQMCIDAWQFENDKDFIEKYGFDMDLVAALAVNFLTKKYLLKQN